MISACSVYTEDLLLPSDPPVGSGGGGGSGGSSPACNTASDCPGDDTECRTRTCFDGACGEEPAPARTACMTSLLCDGQGECVECVDASDCLGDDVCDPSLHQCVLAGCLNSQQDPAETDVDCGGPECGPCDDGQGCAVGNDCTSGVCDGVCQAPTCGDGVARKNERGKRGAGRVGNLPVNLLATSRRELLLDEKTLKGIYLVRRMTAMISQNSQNPLEPVERVLDRLTKTNSNEEFLTSLKSDL